MTPSQLAAIEALVRSIMERYHVPGLGMAIAREGEIVYGRGFGHADVGAARPATVDTVFGLASVSKSFTALAIMQLQDAGRLSVQDPVVKYLPEFRIPVVEFARQPTLHDLLTHTSGLPPMPARWFVFARSIAAERDYGETPVSLDSYPPIDTYADLMDLIAGTPWTPLGPPGRHLSYSNEGYALLGAIIERMSGMSFARYVRTRILEPAGLTRTGFDLDVHDRSAPVATLYTDKTRNDAAGVFPVPWWPSSVWLPAGGMCSTVRDLIRYLEIYRTGGLAGGTRIVSREAVGAMTRCQIEAGPGEGYGYGLIVQADHYGLRVYGHSGERRGISAYVAVVPDRGMTAAVLANLETMPAYSLCLGGLRISLGLPRTTPPVRTTSPCPPLELSAYVGTYRSGEGQTIRVEIDGDGLVFDMGGQRYPARPAGGDAFAVREPELEMYARFLANPRGRPWAVAYGMIIIPRADGDRRRLAQGLALVRSGWRKLRKGVASLRGFHGASAGDSAAPGDR